MVSTSAIEKILTEKLYRIKSATESAETIPEDFLALETEATELPITITDPEITPDHRVVKCSASPPNAQRGPWAWETGDGAITISGNTVGATSIRIVLAKPKTIIGG